MMTILKNNGTRLKYIFLASSAFLLIVMIILSRNAGISCDEVLHYEHSVAVYNYFATHGSDHSALETPVTHLKYYGQSYDNIVTIFTKWFNIDDVYGFRHLMSSLAGWLVIFLTALFAVWLSGYRTGILVLFLFAVSPTFIGHSQNNLKDIPFALAYISGTFFTVRILFSEKKILPSDILFLILSIAFCVSIRAGGLLLICYLYFFFILVVIFKRVKDGKLDYSESGRRLIIITLISAAGYFLSILLWPYALQSPLKNVLESYSVMAHYPDTFRQIFEGKADWSDFMPWYYLPKSMIITIPVIIFVGTLLLLLFSKKIYKSGKALIYVIIAFTILFPLCFAIIGKSNLYSSWRHFLFIYPAIVLIAASGFNYVFDLVKYRFFRWVMFAILFLLSFHPVGFMAGNKHYFYIYYNQLVGGLKGAYGNYETDYYFTGQTEASKWLISYLKENKIDTAVVKATYTVAWQFRNQPGIKTSYFRNEERSQCNWDYAIITNRYIPPYQLKNKIWPPENAIHIIYADSIPICAVLERKTKADFYGYRALEEGRSSEAINYFNEALKINDKDEMIFYNFARALYNDGRREKADSVLKKGLEVNPDCEPILMYLGNIAVSKNEKETAGSYYERLIGVNRKYFEAYIKLAELRGEKDIREGRKLLRTCLSMNPGYKPAILALADTYRKSNPEIAKKYDELASKIK